MVIKANKVTILDNSCSTKEEGNNFITFMTSNSNEDPPTTTLKW